VPAPRLSGSPESLGDLWRRAVELNVGYYRAVGRLVVDYWRASAGVVSELAGTTTTTRPAPMQPPAASVAPAPVMALEAQSGRTAHGVFMVENRLGTSVSGPISVGTLADESGREVEVPLTFEPDVVTLDPGEQLLVQVAAHIGSGLAPGVDYRGEIRVPGLAGTRIPVVLRRVSARRR
jgi:hypothetical protein